MQVKGGKKRGSDQFDGRGVGRRLSSIWLYVRSLAGVILARLFCLAREESRCPNPGFLTRGSHARGNDNREVSFYDHIKLTHHLMKCGTRL